MMRPGAHANGTGHRPNDMEPTLIALDFYQMTREPTLMVLPRPPFKISG